MLSELGDDLRDRKVFAADGAEIGHVSALFIDQKERKVRFLQVMAGGFLGIGEREFLVPIKDVSSTTASEVHINHSREHLIGSPHFDPDLIEQPSRDFWNPYYGYYGVLPYWNRGMF